MATASISCPMLPAPPQSEQPPGAKALSVAASVEAMSIEDGVTAAVDPDSSRESVPAGDVLRSVDGNAGARGATCALRVSAKTPGERGPCIRSHHLPHRFARAADSGDCQDEDHMGPEEQLPAEVPAEELSRRAQMMFSGTTRPAPSWHQAASRPRRRRRTSSSATSRTSSRPLRRIARNCLIALQSSARAACSASVVRPACSLLTC